MTTIRYADSRAPRTTDTLADALNVLRAQYPDMLHVTDDGRTLVWRDEDSATDDDGARAVAEVCE